MQYDLKLYKCATNTYAFSINDFQSWKHCYIVPSIQPFYRYAYEAHRDAVNMIRERPYHLAQKEYEQPEQKELKYTDVSAETKLIDHYKQLLNQISEKAGGIGDIDTKKDQEIREMTYEEIKQIVEELLKVKDQVEDDESQVDIDELIGQFRKLVKKHFSDLLAEDVRERQEDDDLDTPEMGEDLMPYDPQDNMGQDLIPEDDIFSADPLTGKQVDRIILNSAREGNKIDASLVDDIFSHYIERIGHTVSQIDPDYICKDDKRKKSIKVCQGDKECLQINIGENLFVEDILPCGDLAKIYPYQSNEFYTLYWKPIVESIGHIYLTDYNCLIGSAFGRLPETPCELPCSCDVDVIDQEQKIYRVSIKFTESPQSWFIDVGDDQTPRDVTRKKAYTENDFFNEGAGAMVKCIAPELDIDEIGHVEYIIPTSDNNFQLDINFGHHVIRLPQRKIKVINQDAI